MSRKNKPILHNITIKTTEENREKHTRIKRLLGIAIANYIELEANRELV